MKPLDLFFLFGRPFSPLYSRIMAFRASLYKNSVLRVTQLPVPVISVGNLTMGGTGKTPTVLMVAKILKNNGWRPAVVSRGYRGTANEPINVVSDGHRTLLSAEEAGDEPYMLALSLKGLPVLTGKKRALPGSYACDELGCDVIILDDGFQHLAVKRDLNIVLFNATTLAGNSRVFPGGELREPINALKRADAFLLTGVTATNSERAEAFKVLLEQKFCSVPVFTSENSVSGVFKISGEILSDEAKTTPLFAFSGIAHPARFLAVLKDEGFNICGEASFKDHASYSSTELKQLAEKAAQRGASGLITTEKDIVKLIGRNIELPIYYIALRSTPSPSFVDFLKSKLGTSPSPQ